MSSYSLDEDENEEVRSLHEKLADTNSTAPDVAATSDHDFNYIEKAMEVLDERYTSNGKSLVHPWLIPLIS